MTTVSVLKRQRLETFEASLLASRPINSGLIPPFQADINFRGLTSEGYLITQKGELVSTPNLQLVGKMEVPPFTREMWPVDSEYAHLQEDGLITFRSNQYRFYWDAETKEVRLVQKVPAGDRAICGGLHDFVCLPDGQLFVQRNGSFARLNLLTGEFQLLVRPKEIASLEVKSYDVFQETIIFSSQRCVYWWNYLTGEVITKDYSPPLSYWEPTYLTIDRITGMVYFVMCKELRDENLKIIATIPGTLGSFQRMVIPPNGGLILVDFLGKYTVLG